jgi:tripeptide aminopeptidase
VSEAVDLLLELTAIPSPPGEERGVADVVGRYLRGLGIEPEEDDCARSIDSTAGNLYARIEPTAEGTPIFLCAHMDTVPPDGALEPVVEDGVVRNSGGTILGGDNKAAITAMLEGVRRVLAEGVRHAGIELVFTPKEEVGLIGAGAFDHDKLRAQVGYVYDQEGPMGEVVLGAPWSRALEVRFHGRSAHAGMAPEEGRSAIQAAAKAIADLRLGRVDEVTTANVGTISGGTAGNVVPEWCTFLAEARCHVDAKLSEVVQEMLDAFSFAATETDCDVETTMRKSYDGYRLKRDEPAVALAATAFARCGIEPRYGLSGGGADANVFNGRGRRCVNLSHGVFGFHTPDEHVSVADLEAMVDVTVALVEAARE